MTKEDILANEDVKSCMAAAKKLNRGSWHSHNHTGLRDATTANLAWRIKRALTAGISKAMLRKIDACVKYLDMLNRKKSIALDAIHWAIIELAKLPRLIVDQQPSWQHDLVLNDVGVYTASLRSET